MCNKETTLLGYPPTAPARCSAAHTLAPVARAPLAACSHTPSSALPPRPSSTAASTVSADGAHSTRESDACCVFDSAQERNPSPVLLPKKRPEELDELERDDRAELMSV